MAKFCLLVQVVPGSSESRVVSYVVEENLLRVKLKARPEKGEANRALIEVLGDFFNISKQQVIIKVGHKTKRKLVCLEDVVESRIKALL